MCSHYCFTHLSYHQASSISLPLVGNKNVDHSDAVGASSVDAAPTTSSFSTQHLASMIVQKQLRDETRNIQVCDLVPLY